MSRAQGKKAPRVPFLDDLAAILEPGKDRPQTEGERREEGIGDERDIPGGISHNDANPAVVRQNVGSKPAEWRYRKDLAHGVPPDEAGHHDRDGDHLQPRGGQSGRPKYEQATSKPLPVPVYIVEEAGGRDAVKTASPRSQTCPASTAAEPIRLCGINPRRVRIALLNEDTATDIRFGHDLAALAAGTGALLPWPMNSYLWLDTQDELFAIGASGSGTPKISIIEVFQGEPGS